MVLELHHTHHSEPQPHHQDTALAPCCSRRGGMDHHAKHQIPRDGPIIPSNCKTHLTCKPVHPERPDVWNSVTAYVSDWFSSLGLVILGSAVVIGGCIYGKSVIDKNRKKRRDARLEAEGRKPPSQGGSDDDSDGSSNEEGDLRGQRG